MRKFAEHPLAIFPDFRKLLAGRLISAVGDRFFAIALSWWVVSEAGENAKLHLGVLMGVLFLPVVVFGPFFGTMVDRSDKKKCMLAADFCRMTAVAVLCALLYAGALNLPVLYALCFIIAAFVPLFESAVSSSLIQLTDEAHLPAATAADSSVSQFAAVAGSALGSVLIAASGALGAFCVNAASFFISFAAVLWIRADLSPSAAIRLDYGKDLKNGFAYIFANKPVFYLLLMFAAVNFFAAPVLLLMPMLVKFVVKETAVWLAVFEVFFALGSGLAAVVMSFRRRYSRVYESLFAGLMLMAFALAGLRFTDNKYAMAGLLFSAGASTGFVNAIAAMLFQNLIPGEMKGRFFAALSTLCYAVIPAAFAFNGALAGSVSINFVLVFNAAGTAALSGLALSIPRIRNEI